MNFCPPQVDGPHRARSAASAIDAGPRLRAAAGGRADRDRRAAGISRGSRRPARACRSRSSASTTSAASASPGRARRARASALTAPPDARSTASRAGVALRSRADPCLRRQPAGRGGGLRWTSRSNNAAWLFVAAGVPAGAVQRRHPADDGRQLFGAGHLREQPVLLERRRLVSGTARPASSELGGRFYDSLARNLAVLRHHPGDRGAARRPRRAVHAAPGLDAWRPAS